jgi:hypothetical protein
VKAKKTGGRTNRPPVHSVYGLSGPTKATGFVVVNPKGYFLMIQTHVSGGGVKTKFIEAEEPTPIEEFLEDFKDTNGGLKCCDLFLHRSTDNPNLWDVSNGLTGLRVTAEPKRNKKEAAHDALERICTKGSMLFWEAVSSHLLMSGATPRYRRET